MKRLLSRWREIAWDVLAVAAMVLVVWSFAERGQADATTIMWVAVCLGMAQMAMLHRRFTEMLATDQRLLGELQGLADRLAVQVAMQAERGDE